MPLARHALYCWGLEVLVTPTWDRGEPWLSTLRHVAKEGRVYVIACGNAVHITDVPDRWPFKPLLKHDDDGWVNPGDSAIVDPDGKFVTGPCHGAQEIIYGEIDLDNVTGPRWQLDVAGHYGRPDVFRLLVNRERQRQLETPGAGDAAFAAATEPSSPLSR